MTTCETMYLSNNFISQAKRRMAKVIESNGAEYDVEPNNGTDFTLEELKGFIRCEEKCVEPSDTVELIPLPGDRYMVVNEDGRALGLDRNEKAEEIWAKEFPRDQYVGGDGIIVGNVLVCDRKNIK